MEQYCGLDISNKSTSICIVNESGEVEYESSCATTSESLQAVLKKYKGLRCVVEASPLAESVCQWVEGAGCEINILDTRQAKVVTATKKKTDSIDARKLAQLSRTGWYTKVHRKSGKARNIRSYLTARMQVVKAATGMSSTIRGLLRAHGIVISAGSGKKFESSVRQALKDVDPMLKDAIEPLLSLQAVLQSEERRMYKALRQTVVKDNPEVKRLMTVPGVGPATAAAFVATIDDPRRFPSGEQLASYLGLVPSVYQSGEVEIRGRITKQGDSLLRWLLVEASTTLLARSQKQCALKTWGLELQEKKGFGKARVAVARKLACLLLHLWKTEQTFNIKAAA